MTFRWVEMQDSRESTVEPPTIKLRYRAIDADSETFVQAAALSLTGATYASLSGLLFRQDVQIAPDGFRRWIATIPYGRNVAPPQGQWTWSFDTTGGSFHIKASKQTVSAYGGGAAVTDYKQLIGVHDNEVDGADIVIPAMKLNVQYKHPLGAVNMAFAMNIFDLTGMVNSTTMFTRPAGEVLFLGGTGNDGTQAEAEAGYQFAISRNLQNQVVGAISGISKDGWDIAWIKWKDAVASSKPVKQPESIYIERVYERTNLAAALGFGG